MELRLGRILLVALALAFAGCADDGGDDDGGDGGDSTGTPTGTSTTTMTTTSTMGPGPGGMAAETYVNGTVSGVADCALIGAGGPTAMGDTQSVPAGMDGASYQLTFEGEGVETLCLYFDDGTSGLSGAVPAGATSFTVYADGAPAGVSYSVRFTPLM